MINRSLILAFVILASGISIGCDGKFETPLSPTGSSSVPVAETPGNNPPPAEPGVPEPVQSATMIGAGDIGWCGEKGAEQTAMLIDQNPTDVVYTLGDNAYMDGTLSDFNRCYDPFWGHFKSRTRPAIGNHEYNSPGANGYFEYFSLLSGQNFYSYDLGAWHVVVLDTERGGSAQLSWLEADLQRNSSKPMLAQMHRPLFSSGPSGGNSSLRTIWELLNKYNVKIILAGHDHLYERFSKLNSGGQSTPDGIRQFIVGTGGAGLYSFKDVKSGSEFRASAWGLLKLTLNADSYIWEFITVNGQTIDRGAESVR